MHKAKLGTGPGGIAVSAIHRVRMCYATQIGVMSSGVPIESAPKLAYTQLGAQEWLSMDSAGKSAKATSRLPACAANSVINNMFVYLLTKTILL